MPPNRSEENAKKEDGQAQNTKKEEKKEVDSK